MFRTSSAEHVAHSGPTVAQQIGDGPTVSGTIQHLHTSPCDDVRHSNLINAAGDSADRDRRREDLNGSEMAEIMAMILQSQSPDSVGSRSEESTGAGSSGSSEPVTQPEHAGSRTSKPPADPTDTSNIQPTEPMQSRHRGLKRKSSQVLDKDTKVVRSRSVTGAAAQKMDDGRTASTTANGPAKSGRTAADSARKQTPGVSRITPKKPASDAFADKQSRVGPTCAPRLVLPGPNLNLFDPLRQLDFSVPSAPIPLALPNSVGLTARRLSQLQPSSSGSSSASSSCHSCLPFSLSPGSHFSTRSALSSPSPPLSVSRAMSPSATGKKFPVHLDVEAWVLATGRAATDRSPSEPPSQSTVGAGSVEESEGVPSTSTIPVQTTVFYQNLCFGKKKKMVDLQVAVSVCICFDRLQYSRQNLGGKLTEDMDQAHYYILPSEPGHLRARSVLLQDLRQHVKELAGKEKEVVSYQWMRDLADDGTPTDIKSYRIKLC